MPDKKFYKDMLFDHETSYRTYHPHIKIKPMVKTVYKAKPSCYRIRPPPLKDIHTLIDWKDARVPPFALYHTVKDVVRTNPWSVQQPYGKEEDLDRETVQKSRPRLVMTPALCMDDIADSAARKNLCADIYTSVMTRFMRQAVAALPLKNVKSPLPGLPAPANPICLPKLQPGYVSPEWRIQSAAWDGKQLRTYCDQTREFWLKQDPMKCRTCDEAAIVDTHRKMQRQLKSSR